MAGLGYKDFTAGAVLTAAQVDGYLMEQSVMNFAGTAARGSALSSVQSAGMMAHVGGGTVTVYDGSAWQQVYPAQSGLVYVAGTAFSAVSSVSVNNCFTSTYQNYLLMANGTASADVAFLYRLRLSGTDATAANYSTQRLVVDTTTATGSRATGATSGEMTSFLTTETGVQIVMYSPNVAVPTRVVSQAGDGLSGNPRINYNVSLHSLSTAYDGITIFPGSGTMTGTVRVYGYRNS